MRRFAFVMLLGLGRMGGNALAAEAADEAEEEVAAPKQELVWARETVEKNLAALSERPFSADVAFTLTRDGKEIALTAKCWSQRKNYRVDVTSGGRLAFQCIVTPEKTIYVPYTRFPHSDQPFDPEQPYEFWVTRTKAMFGWPAELVYLEAYQNREGLCLWFSPRALLQQQAKLFSERYSPNDESLDVAETVVTSEPENGRLNVALDLDARYRDDDPARRWFLVRRESFTLLPDRDYRLARYEESRREDPRFYNPGLRGTEAVAPVERTTTYRADYADGPLPVRVAGSVRAESRIDRYRSTPNPGEEAKAADREAMYYLIPTGTFSHTLALENVSYDEIPDAVFTLAGLNAPAKARVYDEIIKWSFDTEDRQEPDHWIGEPQAINYQYLPAEPMEPTHQDEEIF